MCSAPLIYMLDPNLSQMCSDSPFQTGSFSTEHRAVWIPSCGTNKSPSFGPGLVRWRFPGLCGLPAGGLRDGVAVFPVPVGSRRELLLRTWLPPLFLCLRRWELHRQSKALRSGPATAPSTPCLNSLPEVPALLVPGTPVTCGCCDTLGTHGPVALPTVFRRLERPRPFSL